MTRWGGGVYGKGHLGVSFIRGPMCADGMGCERRWIRWVLWGLPLGIQECLERFHRVCVDYLSRQFVPKWDIPKCEGELATARTAWLLLELVGVAA